MGEQNVEKGRRREKRRRRGRREESQERYGTCMETMILVWIIGLLDFCMELFDEEETINPLFFLLNWV